MFEISSLFPPIGRTSIILNNNWHFSLVTGPWILLQIGAFVNVQPKKRNLTWAVRFEYYNVFEYYNIA